MKRPKPDQIRIIKELAQLGGIAGVVMLSSGNLAQRLGMSQQSASGKILELVRDELVTRQMGARKQALQLTPKAVSLLRKEHSDYLKLFEAPGKMTITGQVASGLGEGRYYVGQDAYQAQFLNKLGMKPFPGTLNLRLSGTEFTKLDLLKQSPGIPLEGFVSGGRTFGPGRCFRASINELDVAIVVPNRSHYSDIIEIICDRQLRKALSVRDGDTVKLEVLM